MLAFVTLSKLHHGRPFGKYNKHDKIDIKIDIIHARALILCYNIFYIFTTALGATCNKNSPDCTVANSKCVPVINNDYKCVCDDGFKKVGSACAAKGIDLQKHCWIQRVRGQGARTPSTITSGYGFIINTCTDPTPEAKGPLG